MNLYICIEPSFQNSHACTQIMRGIRKEIIKRRYTLKTIIDGTNYKQIDYDQLFGNDKRIIILIGTFTNAISRMTEFFNSKQIHVVLIESQLGDEHSNISSITMDYPRMTRTILEYFNSTNRFNTVLFGINPHKSVDVMKRDTFTQYLQMQGIDRVQSRLFVASSSLEICCEDLEKNLSNIDSVICCSDDDAIFLIQYLSKKDISIPRDIYIASFGNSTSLSELFPPTLTALTINYEALGAQAVRITANLAREDMPISMSVRMKSELVIRQSTANERFNTNSPNISKPNQEIYLDANAYRYLRFWVSVGSQKALDFIGIRIFGRFSDGFRALYLHCNSVIYLDGTLDGQPYQGEFNSCDTDPAFSLPAGFEGYVKISLNSFTNYSEIKSMEITRYSLDKLHHILLVLPGNRPGCVSFWNDFSVDEINHEIGANSKSQMICCVDHKDEAIRNTMFSFNFDVINPQLSGQWTLANCIIDGAPRMAFHPHQNMTRGDVAATFTVGRSYYYDPALKNISKIEALLASCDELDLKIILGLINKHSYPKIAENLFSSDNMIKYRINRMCQYLGVKTKVQFMGTLTEFVSKDTLRTICEHRL